ncbi:hypothetical protein [Breoghania sp. JC706]|uniref:hypothetical protein n=1 Tax=Breoghania sp. JC706 TaxID=3117732 RepID=UPI0030083BB3
MTRKAEHETRSPVDPVTVSREVVVRRTTAIVRTEGNSACAVTRERVANLGRAEARAHAQAGLDEALRESFPASDPVSLLEPTPGD